MARHFIERDVLGGQIGRSRDDQRVANACRKSRRPRQRLHSPEAAAHGGGPTLDSEMVGEARLRIDPILDGDEREIGAIRPSGLRIDRLRASRTEATP